MPHTVDDARDVSSMMAEVCDGFPMIVITNT